MQRRFLDYLIVSFKGLAMGAADVVPGVSGGTIAFISGIYEELLESIDNLKLSALKIWRKDGFSSMWKAINGNFLLSLFLGIAISIISLARAIKWLLNNEPVLLWSFFFGLVLASIFYIGKQITKWNLAAVIFMLLAAVLSYLITIAEPFASPDSLIYLFFCGFVAIIAMILPGVSGAFILLLLGAYETALDTVNDLSEGISTMNGAMIKDAMFRFLSLGIGAIIGIKAFSKLLNWMFKNYKNLTMATLTGFMIGSLNKIWPWKETLSWRTNSHGEQVPLLEKSILPANYTGDDQLVMALAFVLIGFLTIFILERLGNQKPNANDVE